MTPAYSKSSCVRSITRPVSTLSAVSVPLDRTPRLKVFSKEAVGHSRREHIH